MGQINHFRTRDGLGKNACRKTPSKERLQRGKIKGLGFIFVMGPTNRFRSWDGRGKPPRGDAFRLLFKKKINVFHMDYTGALPATLRRGYGSMWLRFDVDTVTDAWYGRGAPCFY